MVNQGLIESYNPLSKEVQHDPYPYYRAFHEAGMQERVWGAEWGAADEVSPLRAVLDTNFWLATHVVVVTLGYASKLVPLPGRTFNDVQRLRTIDQVVRHRIAKVHHRHQ